MSIVVLESRPKPRLKALLDHLGVIEDTREPWRVAHPLDEVLFLVVCATICDCDHYENIASWGEAKALPALSPRRPGRALADHPDEPHRSARRAPLHLVSAPPSAPSPPTVAAAIRDAGADYLLAVKANQPTLRADVEPLFAGAGAQALDTVTDVDKGHGRIEQRTTA